jgi:hypothetical protein
VASINQTYNDLILVLQARGTDAGTLDSLTINLNGDAAGNYDFLEGNGSSSAYVPVSNAGSGTMICGRMAAAGATATWFSQVTVTIVGYTAATWVKALTSQYGGGTSSLATTLFTGTCCGVWHNTAAVNRVQFAGSNTANLLAGSTLRIYGRL